MRQSIFLIALIIGGIFFCPAQQIRLVPVNKVNKLNDGWHKLSSQGALLDVEIRDGVLVKGNVTWFDGAKYSGTFYGNKIGGKGTFTWINGEYYEGNFKNNQRHGKGSMHYKDGTKYSGKWKNNQKNGKGKLYDDTGKIIKQGLWKQNVFIDQKDK
ncbi:hypothetical protein [Aquimarina sp. RZ0]|uniref:hypothetical protein n=1 Tax=Aquimarina sp. RZ0 TaxID=2607730 RepID=UPI0011F1D6CE|nr:hypothetical protein [Aquimarina sp. RZ0]KAA1246533.1 hypothetical protein F0000_07165 [Aquimarina sp. RZ0]